MIKNIVFDIGGVLVEVRRNEAIRQFQAIGLADADQLIDSYQHKGLFFEIENGVIDADTFCRLLCEHAGKNIARKAIEQAWRSLILDPPAYKLVYLLELRKKYKLYLLSNNNPILIDGWARTPAFSPAGRPVSDYFDRLYLSYEMKCSKPDPAIYEAMIRDSGVIPSETLFVEDGLKNLEAGKVAGFQTYLAINGEDWRKPIEDLLSNQ
ncbi:MAG: HAD family phosphatase [Tannerella sp.]|jgi:putative hydrolase of the HAD superfamily|nr:HAD family phosphatase [Tannerella sp.]